jgi:hypothetical protein
VANALKERVAEVFDSHCFACVDVVDVVSFFFSVFGTVDSSLDEDSVRGHATSKLQIESGRKSLFLR